MNKSKSYYNSPIIFVPILLFCVVMFFFISDIGQDKNNNYNSLTETTKATVTKYTIEKVKQKHGAYNYYHNVTFEFVANKKKYVVSDTYNGPKDPISSVGSKIAIHYNDNNPRSAVPDEFIEYDTNNDNSIKGYFIILIIVIIIFLFYSSNHKKNK